MAIDSTGSASEATACFVSQRPSASDLWRVFEAQLESVHAATFEWARRHGDFAPLLEGMTPEAIERTKTESRRIVQLAIASDWATYLHNLRSEGFGLAERGVGTRSWYELGATFRRQMLPPLLEACGAEPSRAADAILALQDLIDQSVAELVEACIRLKESQLRARERDLATTLDSIGDAVIVTDREGRIVRMNPVAEKLTGIARSEGAGRRLHEVVRVEDDETGEAVEVPLERVLRECVVTQLAGRNVLVAKDGTKRPIADSGAPIRRESGDVDGVVLVFRDVTEQRHSEELLRRWELVFKHASWGICLGYASEVRFAAVNPAYAAMHGYTVEELVGAPISIMWPPETRAKMDGHTDNARSGDIVAETIHVRKDGTRFPVEVVATSIRDKRGQPVWFVANVQDITERRRLQEDRARAIQLEAENRRYEEANRLKSEFLANMSHELRTPLNSILGFAELLYDEQVGSLLPKQKEFLEDVLSSGRHLLRLINDVLDLAKIEAGKVDFTHEPVHVDLLIQTVVQSLSTIADSKNIGVEIVVSPSLTDVVLDPGRFKQVLYNYLSNALKFTPERGSIVVRALPDDAGRFRLEVEDNGPGIKAEDADRLFVAFQQLESGANKRHSGTGLGLALTKRLVETQGGSVGVRPALGHGSIFFAILPQRPERWSQLPPSLEAPRILVIDGDAGDRKVVTDALQNAGFAVCTVANCSDAMEQWKQRPFDAVTIDLLTPEDGELQAFFGMIRTDPRSRTVPVFAITVVSQGRMATGFPITDILSKPIDPKELLSALERCGVSPSRGRPVVVVDDDLGSLKLMEATLNKLGYDAHCFTEGTKALRASEEKPPLAVIVDLMMPEMDGFMFIERFRAKPENRLVPVMVWTVKDLSTAERRILLDKVQIVIAKGADAGVPLAAMLKKFLPSKSHSQETS
jgi:PAS domain S-box-containing protein